MISIIKEHFGFRHQLLALAKLDLTKTYRSAALGWLWVLVQPLTLLFVYWFVLHIGLHATTTTDNISFLSWLMVGMIAWLFISDMLNKGTASIRAYKYLVIKMKFPVSVIPTFVGMARIFVHICLLSIVMLYIGFQAEGVRLTWVQIPLYMLFMFAFFVSWSLFAAPLAAMSRDFENLVKAAVRMLFWLSGILWNIHQMPIQWIKDLLLFNPITFFVEGYRNSLLYGKWFYQDTKQLIIFGVMFVIMVILAVITYRRSRKELADAL